MAQKKVYLWTYLYIAIIFGFLGLIDNILTALHFTDNLFYRFLAVMFFFFFFYQIISLAVFFYTKVDKLAYIFPFYYLVGTLILYLFVFMMRNLLNYQVWTALIIIGLVTSFFEIGFGFYLLRRLDYI